MTEHVKMSDQGIDIVKTEVTHITVSPSVSQTGVELRIAHPPIYLTWQEARHLSEVLAETSAKIREKSQQKQAGRP